MYEKKVDDGFEVLEVPKGTWVEAIFAKLKPEAEKPRLKLESRIDEEGEDYEIEDTYNRPDEDDDDEIEDPKDEDITEENYSTMMEIDTDPDEEAEDLSVFDEE